MKQCLLYLLLLIFFISAGAFGQEVPPKPVPQMPMHAGMPVHAGFDVIIKKNGELVYGLVKEVGPEYIRYQRTDIPDGPIYLIHRSEVYAISYRNQAKDILSPMQFLSDSLYQDSLKRHPLTTKAPGNFSYSRNSRVLLGIGMIRGFTKVDDAEDYSSSTSLPMLSLAYESGRSERLRFGLQLSVGSRKFTRSEFSAYDNATKDIELKEDIFAIYLYGKYGFSSYPSRLLPYVMGGLGIQSSYVKSDYTFRFLNNSSQSVLVNAGGRSVGIGVLLRAGTVLYLNDQFSLFADAGLGPSVINLGIVFNTGK